jgi:hypothetical protein
MTFGITIKTNRRLAEESLAFSRDIPKKTVESWLKFPYTPRPKYFIKKVGEGEKIHEAFINYMILPRMFSIRFWGRCRIQINFWPFFTILIKI